MLLLTLPAFPGLRYRGLCGSELAAREVASEEPQPRGLDPSLALPQANPSRLSHYPNQILLSGGTHRSRFHVYCAPELSVLWKLPVPYPASACQGSQSHKHTVCWCSLLLEGQRSQGVVLPSLPERSLPGSPRLVTACRGFHAEALFILSSQLFFLS